MLANRSRPSGVIPTLYYEDVSKAIDWLCGAFSFTERFRYGPPTSIGGAQLLAGDGIVMLSKARVGQSPAGGDDLALKPPPDGEVSVIVSVHVDNVDRISSTRSNSGHESCTRLRPTRSANGNTRPKTWPGTDGHSPSPSRTYHPRSGAQHPVLRRRRDRLLLARTSAQPAPESFRQKALLWIAAATLFVRDRFALGRLEVAMLASFAGLVGWVALSATWSTSSERSILEVQRDLVYLGSLLVVFLVARGRSIAELLVAVYGVALVTSTFALAHLFFSGPEADARLSYPLGYPNALALVAAIGALLAAAFAAHARAQPARALSAACLVVWMS